MPRLHPAGRSRELGKSGNECPASAPGCKQESQAQRRRCKAGALVRRRAAPERRRIDATAAPEREGVEGPLGRPSSTRAAPERLDKRPRSLHAARAKRRSSASGHPCCGRTARSGSGPRGKRRRRRRWAARDNTENAALRLGGGGRGGLACGAESCAAAIATKLNRAWAPDVTATIVPLVSHTHTRSHPPTKETRCCACAQASQTCCPTVAHCISNVSLRLTPHT